jgi:hypothetical protein
MLDFNPSAMARGIGKVVRGSTFEGYPMDWWEAVASLPYVEVVNNRVFDASIRNIILDEERMLIFSQARGGTVSVLLSYWLISLTISLNRWGQP